MAASISATCDAHRSRGGMSVTASDLEGRNGLSSPAASRETFRGPKGRTDCSDRVRAPAGEAGDGQPPLAPVETLTRSDAFPDGRVSRALAGAGDRTTGVREGQFTGAVSIGAIASGVQARARPTCLAPTRGTGVSA